MMSRCIGLNKKRKKCRRKIPEGQYFCCESHKPINKEILTEECIMCMEKVEKKTLWVLKCGHAFHFPCLDEWFCKMKEEEDKMECPICMREYKKELKKQRSDFIDVGKQVYYSKILDILESKD